MLKKSIFPVVMIVALSGFVSCSKLDEMGENAEAAKDNSGKAAEAAGQSREEIANSRMMQRSGGSSTSRREALKAIQDMKSFEMKVTEASKFVKAFEYQLWTGQKYDTEEYLLALYDDAMREFFRGVIEVNGGEPITKTELNPFRSGLTGKSQKLKDRDMNVYALAVAMHGIHNVQRHVTVPREVKLKTEISIYDLIKKALTKIEKVEKGDMDFSKLEEYEYTVYNYKNEALKLINARANMFLVMNLAKVSSLKDNKIDALLLGLSKVKNYFNSKFPELNLGEKKRANDYVDAAKKVKVFQESIGLTTELMPKLKTYYRKMRLPKEGEISTMSGNDAALMQEHRDLLSNFFKIEGAKISTL